MSNLVRKSLVVPFVLIPLIVATPSNVVAQAELDLDEGISGLHQTLRTLRTTASVLHVVAHPDDEDGPLMCYCARGLGVRAMLFSITRGEGGANLVSSHFFDELGALRTLEHAKAAQYYGTQLFYSSAADYGYSKNLAEANRTWNKGTQILGALVEVIRREKPTVIMSRFRGDPRDGHGHHQMAGLVTRLAFRAASDPDQFPEQIERGLRPWQPLKLYVTRRPDWNADDRQHWTIAVPTGQYDPVLGKSYGQIARFGLGFQRSQGISGHIGDSGERVSYYGLQDVAEGVALEERETKPTDNLPVQVREIGSLPNRPAPAAMTAACADLQDEISRAIDGLKIEAPQAMIPELTKALSTSRRIHRDLDKFELTEDQRWLASSQLTLKQRQLQSAICLAAGVDLDASVENESDALRRTTAFLVPGQTLRAAARFVVRNDVPIILRSIAWKTPTDWHPRPASESDSLDDEALAPNKPKTIASILTIPSDTPPTRPYWSRTTIREPFYSVTSDNHQAPLPAPPLVCQAAFEVNGVTITTSSTAQTRIRDPLFGDVRYAAQIVPPVSISFPLHDGVMPNRQPSYDVTVVMRSSQDADVDGSVRIESPAGWDVTPAKHDFSGPQSENQETRFHFSLNRSARADATEPANANVDNDGNVIATQSCDLRAVVTWNGHEYSEGFTTVTARDLDRLNIYRPADQVVRSVDVVVQGTPKVGYINGSGDEVAQSLGMLGIDPTILTDSDLSAGHLNRFDVILIGVRAYAVRSDLRQHNSRLLDFVKEGGTLIVQYQTPEFDHDYGPFSYTMGRRPEEVSEEDSPVVILAPDHPLMSQPNKIGSADFDGWLEQRGSKFLTTWDDRYKALLECHDTGQSPQEGGLLIARYGKGVYVYSAYAWYRQLPNGVPGAFRIMANHLSLPSTMREGD